MTVMKDTNRKAATSAAQGSAVDQTAQAEMGIRMAAGLVPAVVVLIALLVMTKYSLTDAVHAKITKGIADRREHERKSADNEQGPSDSSTEPRKSDQTQATDQNPSI